MNNRLVLRLLEKIHQYQQHDNPEPDYENKSFWEQTTTFFASAVTARGAEGRKRASAYHVFVIHAVEQDALLKAVIEDCKDDDSSCLGTSHLLRQRLLEALCEFYAIPQATIDERVSFASRSYIAATAGAAAARPLHEEITRMAMLELVDQKYAATKPRRVSFNRNGIGDDKL